MTKQLPIQLLIAQRAASVFPALRFDIGNIAFLFPEGLSTCHNTRVEDPQWDYEAKSRILGVPEHEEQPYNHTATLLLNNWDGLFTGKNMIAERCIIHWGLITPDGAMYIRRPPLKVTQQAYISSVVSKHPLAVQLSCEGIPNQLNQDEASGKWVAPITYTLKDIMKGVLEATLEPYTNAVPYRVIFGDEEGGSVDDLYDTICPGATFVIAAKETRMNVIARLCDMTYMVFMPGIEAPDSLGRDTVHIYRPTMGGNRFDAEFSLQSKINQPFMSLQRIDSITKPNHIIVKTPKGVSPAYIGEARDALTIARDPYNEIIKYYFIEGLTSDSQAAEAANAVLQKIILAKKGSAFRAPLHCGLECFDYIKLTDTRDPNLPQLRGNVGVIKRVFKPEVPEYYMDTTFGAWLTPKRLLEIIEGSGFVDAETEDDITEATNFLICSSPMVKDFPDGGTLTLGGGRFDVPADKGFAIYKTGVCKDDGTVDSALYVQVYDHDDSIELYKSAVKYAEGNPIEAFPASQVAGHDIECRLYNNTGDLVNAQGSITIGWIS